jgi:hypothetical protein
MRVTTNEKLIRQRAKIVRWTSLAGLGVLFAGLVASFDQRYYYLALPALIAGFVLANISAYNANHFVKEPRPDHVLEKALKGFDNNYHLFNFTGPVPHVLLTPGRLYVLMVKTQDGTIRKQGNKWKRAFSVRRLLMFFGEEALGNPARQAEADAERLRATLTQTLGETVPPVEPIVIFTHPNVNLELPESSTEDADEVPVVTAKDLKKHVRGQPRANAVDVELRRRLVELLQGDTE